MLPSKSRSGFLEFGKKSHRSVLSRTISAAKFCRGDSLISQIDATTLKPLDRSNFHGAANSSEVVNQLAEELKMTKSLLEMAEQEKDRAIDHLQEMKIEIEVSKQIDNLSAEKDMLIDGLEVELSIVKASRSVITESLSESKRRIKELEKKLEKIRVCENKKEHAIAKLDDQEKVENYEINSLKNEMKLVLEEKEKSERAMDDLALALDKARLEANNANENLSLKEAELAKVKKKAEQNAKLLNEAKNTIERLRLEADESHLAWNDIEIGFVNCVKEAEEERARTQEENLRLIESLRSSDTTVDMFREENIKLKAVLKQAADIANIENSPQPNNTQAENRKLSVKELNWPLIVASRKDPKTDCKKHEAKTKSMKTMFDDSKKGKLQKNRLSFDLSELKRNNFNQDVTANFGDEVPIKAEILSGSIFDTTDPPKLLTQRVSLSFLNGKSGVNSEDFNHLKVSNIDGSGNSWIWKRRAFLQTFEDLIKGKIVEKEEKPIE